MFSFDRAANNYPKTRINNLKKLFNSKYDAVLASYCLLIMKAQTNLWDYDLRFLQKELEIINDAKNHIVSLDIERFVVTKKFNA